MRCLHRNMIVVNLAQMVNRFGCGAIALDGSVRSRKARQMLDESGKE
jgi:hypothetical protein